jgi:hypothetical protein
MPRPLSPLKKEKHWYLLNRRLGGTHSDFADFDVLENRKICLKLNPGSSSAFSSHYTD